MKNTMSKSKLNIKYVLASIFIGAVVGFLYLVFEWVVNNGTNWLWNDLVESDTFRCRVIPLAIIMSIILSAVVLFFKKNRLQKTSTNLLDELNDIKPTKISDILVILVIGALSLIAGASLGPEASLVAASLGVTAWLSGKMKILKEPTAFVFGIASIGALLAAFFNSLLPVVIPILILKQKGKLDLNGLLISVFAGVSAWGIVRVIKDEAYIQLPVSGTFSITNTALAFLLGFVSILLALIIKWLIHLLHKPVSQTINKIHWLISAGLIGLLLGVLYFIGGQTVQFSGSEGLVLLEENILTYSALALLGLVVVKIFATVWSTITGYRGGLVFPSIFMGMSLSLAFSTIFGLSGSNEAGVVIGSVTGILMAMVNPIVGVVLAFALFPLNLISVVIGGAIGSFVAIKIFAKFNPPVKS